MAIRKKPVGMNDPATLNINNTRRYQRAEQTFQRATARANRQAQLAQTRRNRQEQLAQRQYSNYAAPTTKINTAVANQRNTSTMRRQQAIERRLATGNTSATGLNTRKKTLPVRNRRRNSSALQRMRTLDRYKNAIARRLGR